MNIHTYNLYKNGLFIPWLKAGIQSFIEQSVELALAALKIAVAARNKRV